MQSKQRLKLQAADKKHSACNKETMPARQPKRTRAGEKKNAHTPTDATKVDFNEIHTHR